MHERDRSRPHTGKRAEAAYLASARVGVRYQPQRVSTGRARLGQTLLILVMLYGLYLLLHYLAFAGRPPLEMMSLYSW
jgi:hypothetical protein